MVFPKTVFGKKERSFNTNWYSKFPWLRYDIKSDYTKGDKAVSGNSDSAFMTRGFRKWKKCGECSLDHQNSIIHMKAYYGLMKQMLI